MRRSALISGALIILILVIWEAACRGFDLPDFILPMPSRIISVAVLQAPMLLPHAATTAMEVLIGILLSLMVSVPLAMIMFANPAVENAHNPMPKVIRQEIAAAGLRPLAWIPVHRAPLLSDKLLIPCVRQESAPTSS